MEASAEDLHLDQLQYRSHTCHTPAKNIPRTHTLNTPPAPPSPFTPG